MDMKAQLAIESLSANIGYTKNMNRVNTYPVSIEMDEAENILSVMKEQQEQINMRDEIIDIQKRTIKELVEKS